MASDTPQQRLAVIVCIDMAGYSAFAERDEAQAAAAVAALRACAETVSLQHSGRVFNSAGDGFLLEFQSASNALAAAFAVLDHARAGAPQVRIGIHLGEVTVTGAGDLLGHTVNVASRLQSEAGENCIIASRAVFDLARGPNAARLVSIGPVDIDKTSETVEAFAFDPRGRHGGATGRRPRRRWIVAAIAASVAGVALVIALWSASLAGANREAMMRELRADVTRQLVSTGALNQESIDSAYLTITDLSQSNLSLEQAVFSLLREGQTASAAGALESFAADLERQGMHANAATTWARAGALVQFADKERALADFRRAFELAPQSVEHFAALVQAIVGAHGYADGFAFAGETARNGASGQELVVYANLHGSIMAGDVGETRRQIQFIAASEENMDGLNNPYLGALHKIARGYLAFQELDLRTARALYQEGRAVMAQIPGHGRDHQQGWLLLLSAMGDFRGAWRDGQAFVAERNESGAPAWSQMMITTCIAGLQVDSAIRAEPYCRAGARGVAGAIGEPSGELALAMLETEKNNFAAARAHLEAARQSRWYAAIPSTMAYAGWTEARIAAKEGHIEQMHAVLDRTMRRVRASPALAPLASMFAAFLERRRADEDAAAGRTADACAALARAIAAYRRIGGEQGAATAARAGNDLECAAA